MLRLCVLTFSLFLGLTQTVYAISINEVAWMGSAANANHEWIELYNASDTAVFVGGWSLTDGVNLNIQLSGTIEPLSYAVLERTSDESAPGPAFLIYSGALVNTGATLTLRNNSGVVVDQVTGGTNWQNIGGDNVTKETAQYTATGWVTDVATPGALNGNGRIIPPVTESSTTTTTTSAPPTTSSGSSKSGSNRISAAAVRLKNPETKMTIVTDVQNVAYVNQIIPLKVDVGGTYENQESMVRFVWNFGDLHTAEGKSVSHTYEYPGEYVVTVQAKNGKVEQVARHEIKVLPVSFSITRNERGDIQVHNNAPYDTDISGYLVKGTESVVFPPRTIILSRGTITIPKVKIGSGRLVALYDTKGQLVASTYQELVPPALVSTIGDSPKVTLVPGPVTATVTTPAPTPFGFFTERAVAAGREDLLPNEVIMIESNEAAAAAAAATLPGSRNSYLALIIMLGLIFLGVVLSNRPTVKTEA